jgi:hypothetical protein
MLCSLGGPSLGTDGDKNVEQNGLYLVDLLYRMLKYEYVLLDGSLAYK